jgi:HSP20 family protein
MTITKFRPTHNLMRDMFSPVGFDSFVNDFFTENRMADNGKNNFQPVVDVVENDQTYQIHASIPGVKKEDIVLDVKANELIISGERSNENESKDAKRLVSEIRYGSFSRTFYLPDMVNKDKIEAKFENGILKVVIPKVEKAKPKTIAIK